MPVEQHEIFIFEVPFYHKRGFERVCDDLAVLHETQVNTSSIGSDDVIRSRVFLWPVDNKLFHFFDVPLGNTGWNG
ncbi:MAG: hypothetical protein RBG13Loki_4130 [Promethearchaeota archaeon CR_4]|nr:MAG: hypothetical protein RBG13Loki_4130 [Candidatus Lokiarchaeota archaeon CR_4]